MRDKLKGAGMRDKVIMLTFAAAAEVDARTAALRARLEDKRNEALW